MEARINVSAENINVIPGKKYTMKDIADIAGCAYSTVQQSLAGDSPKVGEKTRGKIREIAEVVGYKKRARKKNAYYGGNFKSKGEEVARMLELREQGMGNKMIGKKVGRCYTTVLLAIGKEPEYITKEIYRASGLNQRNRYEACRRARLAAQIARFEQSQKEVNELNERVIKLEAEAQRIANEAKAARDLSQSKVIELAAYREAAEKAAKKLGRNLA